LITVAIVVAADNFTVAVDRRINKTRAGSSISFIRRAAKRVSITTAVNLLNDRSWLWPRWRMMWWWWAPRRGKGADNGNSKEGNDLSDLHLDRRRAIDLLREKYRLY
jgi:hypothetical protein